MINLREDEKIIKIVRQHRFVVARPVFWSVVFAGLVLFSFLKLSLDISGYSWAVVVGIILITTLVILYKIYIWRKNTLVVTNQRVLLNIRPSLLSQTVTELLYKDIYDISFKQVGFSALLNRYGKLIIRTPSGSEITFDKIPFPAEVVRMINEARTSASLGR